MFAGVTAPMQQHDAEHDYSASLVWQFFVATFLWSWLIWVPAVVAYRISARAELTLGLLLAGLLGAWGPSLTALALTAWHHGRRGLWILLSRLFIWRVRWYWYAVALLLPSLLLAGGILLETAWLGSASRLDASGWAMRLLAASLFVLPFGPLGEELGWRGYALPKLQQRYSALPSSLVIGVCWAAWHIPLFWIPGAALSPDAQIGWPAFAAYTASVMGTSVLFTWLFNNTGGSVLLAVMLHLSLNVTGQVVMPMFPDWTGGQRLRIDFVSFVVLKWCLVAALIVLLGPARLSWRTAPAARRQPLSDGTA